MGHVNDVPDPMLTYHFWSAGPDPRDVVVKVQDPTLFAVHEVTASKAGGPLRVTLTGPLRKRDGTRGQHRRCAEVDLNREQPAWLTALIGDAVRRLGDER